MQKQIRIIATCELFSVDEVIEEKKSVSRLVWLRNLFLSYKPEKRGFLKVKTFVVNPTLF